MTARQERHEMANHLYVLIIMAGAIITIGLVNLAITNQHTAVLNDQLGNLTVQDQKLIASTFMVTSNNQLLVKNAEDQNKEIGLLSQNANQTNYQNGLLKTIIAKGVDEANKQVSRNTALLTEVDKQISEIQNYTKQATKTHDEIMSLLENKTCSVNMYQPLCPGHPKK